MRFLEEIENQKANSSFTRADHDHVGERAKQGWPQYSENRFGRQAWNASGGSSSQGRAGLKLAPVIRQEFSSFRAKVSTTGHHAYEAGGGAHDDLVLALALAVWGADESSPEGMEKLAMANRELNADYNIYHRLGGAEGRPW